MGNDNNQVHSLVQSLSEAVDPPYLVAEDLDRQKLIIKLMRCEYEMSHKDDPLQKLCRNSFSKFDNFHDLAQAFYGVSLITQSIRDVEEEYSDPDNILSDVIECLKFVSEEHSLLSLQEYMADSIYVIDRMYLLKGEVVLALDNRINFFKRMAVDTFFTAENYISQVVDPNVKRKLEELYIADMPIGSVQNLFPKKTND